MPKYKAGQTFEKGGAKIKIIAYKGYSEYLVENVSQLGLSYTSYEQHKFLHPGRHAVLHTNTFRSMRMAPSYITFKTVVNNLTHRR